MLHDVLYIVHKCSINDVLKSYSKIEGSNDEG